MCDHSHYTSNPDYEDEIFDIFCWETGDVCPCTGVYYALFISREWIGADLSLPLQEGDVFPPVKIGEDDDPIWFFEHDLPITQTATCH